MSELPRGWRLSTLADLATKISDGPFGSHLKSSDYVSNGVRVIRLENIGYAEFRNEHKTFVTEEKYSTIQTHSVTAGDIVFSSFILDLVRAAIVPKEIGRAINKADCFLVRANDSLVSNQYLLYYFSTKEMHTQLVGHIHGATRPRINTRQLKAAKIPLPPLSEQVRIVAKLDELFSDLDAGVASLNQARAQVKVYRQAVLKRAFEGRLVAGKEEEIHRGGAENAEGRGGLPEGWRWERLGSIVDRIADGPFGSSLKSSDYVEQGVRVIRLENIGYMEFKDERKSFVSREKYQTIKKHSVSGGDIIFSSFVFDLVHAAILPDFITEAVNKADCFLVRTSEDKLSRKYLVNYFATKAMHTQLVNEIHGATRPRINTSQLKATLVPLPPLAEQHAIVAEIERRFSVADALDATIDQSLKQAEALRQSLLQKAFRGELVPQEAVDG